MPPRKKQVNMQKTPAANGDKPVKAIVTATSLADLAPRRGTVVVQRPGDQDDLAIPYKELSYKRYWEIGRMVEDPPPHDGAPTEFHRDEKGVVHPAFTVNMTKFRQAQTDAENKRALMRLVEFIDLPIEGEALQERAEILQSTLPLDVINALSAAMRQLTIGSESRVEARAATFHANGNHSTPHL